jgi:SAM-dependent methyltransferase
MRSYPVDPATYAAVQIARSDLTWDACRVTALDIARYRRSASGTTLCCGVRNGHELDLFRAGGFDPVHGVELNPRSTRPDVWVGSFDAMPWCDGAFDTLFSNAFDHALDCAAEWWRVVRPGGTLILAWLPDTPPRESDPNGELTLEDFRAAFPGEIVATGVTVDGYRDVAIRR